MRQAEMNHTALSQPLSTYLDFWHFYSSCLYFLFKFCFGTWSDKSKLPLNSIFFSSLQALGLAKGNKRVQEARLAASYSSILNGPIIASSINDRPNPQTNRLLRVSRLCLTLRQSALISFRGLPHPHPNFEPSLKPTTSPDHFLRMRTIPAANLESRHLQPD